jgi:hypothetical protein
MLPRDKLIGLALRKYFRDADSKNRGYLTVNGLGKAMSYILRVHQLPSPPDTVTIKVMSFLGTPLHDVASTSTTGEMIAEEEGAASKKLGVKEEVFVRVFKYREGGQGKAAPQGLPPIVVLCASLVDMQYEQRVRHVDVLWKTYMIPRTKRMSYEELHEMLKHLAPERRHVPTMDETCLFLGAIKSGSKSARRKRRKRRSSLRDGGGGGDGGDVGDREDEDMELSLDEFAEYVLRGLYQTKRAMKMFSSRGLMHAKITRCLNALSEEATKDHRERRASLSRRPTARLPDADLMHAFMRDEGLAEGGGGEDAR